MKNKKTILTLALIIIGLLSANAQIGKGSMSIGSSFYGGYNKTKINSYSNRTEWSILVDPNFEYFFKNNLSVGFKMGYQINKIKIVTDAQAGFFETIISLTSQTYNPSININKYWFIYPKLMLNISPSIGSYYNELTNYNFVNNPAFPEKEKGNTQITSSWRHAINCPIGINYFVTKKWLLGLQTNLFQYNYQPNSQSVGFYGSNISFLLEQFILLNKNQFQKLINCLEI